jgi:hypothetical protein
MGALFGECVLNRESHYIRRWRLTNTSDTIVILSLTHQRNLDFCPLYIYTKLRYKGVFINPNQLQSSLLG